MFNTEIQAQPITMSFDMSNVEKYDEDKGVLTLFNIETKTVGEDIEGVKFTTEKSYDKKYEISGFLKDENHVEALKAMLDPNSSVSHVVVLGHVSSNTEAKLTCEMLTILEQENSQGNDQGV